MVRSFACTNPVLDKPVCGRPEDRQRHPGLLCEQKDLLGRELAPRVAQQADREPSLHAREIRLHLVVDETVPEFTRESEEILREDGHGRGIEQVLEAFPQAQLDHVVKAQRIELAYGEIGRSEIDFGGEVIDRVDPLTEFVELRIAQAETRLADVADHHADTRRERLIPDFGLLQRVTQPSKPMLGIIRLDDAVHHQTAVMLQEIAQKETADEAGGAGQQHLPEVGRRYGIRRRLLADAAMNEPAQGVDVPPALRRQRSDEGRHPCIEG